MSEHRHFIHYKQYGFLCQFVCELPKKKLVGDLYPFPSGTMAVGRLDEHSEGLLLLTTDGKLSDYIRSRKIEKEYFAQVDGVITEVGLEQLRRGVEIGLEGKKYTSLPCQVRAIPEPDFPPRSRRIRGDHHGPTSWISIIITEGKYRQVRKMTAAAGFPTLRLVRVRIGSITLSNLEPGETREVEELIAMEE